MSGLTVGYLSIDKLDLEIKSSIGTLEEKKSVYKFLLLILTLGQSYFTDFEIASFLARYSSVIKCFCYGSFANLP